MVPLLLRARGLRLRDPCARRSASLYDNFSRGRRPDAYCANTSRLVMRCTMQLATREPAKPSCVQCNSRSTKAARCVGCTPRQPRGPAARARARAKRHMYVRLLAFALASLAPRAAAGTAMTPRGLAIDCVAWQRVLPRAHTGCSATSRRGVASRGGRWCLLLDCVSTRHRYPAFDGAGLAGKRRGRAACSLLGQTNGSMHRFCVAGQSSDV